jgi:hypothetical protein
MLDYCILYKNGDKLALVTVAEGVDIKKYADENIPSDADRIIISKYFVLQNDMEFFDAWDIDMRNKKIIIDMTKARDIWRSQLRIERTKEFNKLDVEFMKALEDGNTYVQSVVTEKKKKLRNITTHPAIEDAQTIEELRKYTIHTLMIL